MTSRQSAPGLRAGRQRSRRGNTLIETSLVFVPLLAMMLGILDFSVAIFLRSTFQHACREGVRYAVTYQLVPGLGHDASIKSVVKTHSMGFLSGETGDSKVKIRYYTPDTFTESPNNAPGNIVEVSVEGFEWGWILPLMRQGSPFQMTARATDRMEGLPGGASAPPR